MATLRLSIERAGNGYVVRDETHSAVGEQPQPRIANDFGGLVVELARLLHPGGGLMEVEKQIITMAKEAFKDRDLEV